jgi:hypothetical protein
MQKILGCLLLFLAPCIGCATDCPPLVLTIYRDQGFEMRVLRGDTAPNSVRARLYSGHKLLRILVSDQDGEFRSDPLPEGTIFLSFPARNSSVFTFVQNGADCTAHSLFGTCSQKPRVKAIQEKRVRYWR